MFNLKILNDRFRVYCQARSLSSAVTTNVCIEKVIGYSTITRYISLERKKTHFGLSTAVLLSDTLYYMKWQTANKVEKYRTILVCCILLDRGIYNYCYRNDNNRHHQFNFVGSLTVLLVRDIITKRSLV